MDPVRVGILGLGTVGCGTVNVLERNMEEISRRAGRNIMVTQAAVRDIEAKRDCSLEKITLTTNPLVIANANDIEIVVELIGGTTLAYEVVKQAIKNGKHVVTANKALIAIHGNELFRLAQEKGVSIAFEAAVAGGIPIIKSIREGLSANRIEWLAGIINGTGNFILTEMKEKGRPFSEVLKEAQDLGYAEFDPAFDIEGTDAAHKLTILASIAFGIPLQFDEVVTEGISDISAEDVAYAAELGYNIKHLGIARRVKNGVELRVHPTLIPNSRLIANVNGVMNAVLVMSDAVGPTLYYGAGAGAGATASAVVADIVDVVRTLTTDPDNRVPHLAFQPDSIVDLPILKMDDIETSYYLRASVSDKPGVLAKITSILAEHDISIEAFTQKDSRKMSQDGVHVVILTHKTREANMNQSILEIENLPQVNGKLVRIRVEQLDR